MDYVLISIPVLVITIIMVYVLSNDYIVEKMRNKKVKKGKEFDRQVGQSRIKKNNKKYRVN